ncbi:MAG: hypothetical protein ACRDD1_13115, partial [Planctomycetia bacterium]
ADPIAANYILLAADVVADTALGRAGKLPAPALKAFVEDTANDPRGRAAAFRLLLRADKTAASMIAGMADDPSVELRRGGVAVKLEEADKILKDGDKDAAKKAFSTALASARDDDQVQRAAKSLRGLDVEVDLAKHFGFLTTWHLVAPFDNVGLKGFNTVYPPEKTPGTVDLKAEYVGKGEGKIGWSKHAADDEDGALDLTKAYDAAGLDKKTSPYKGAVAYATADFHAADAKSVELRMATPNAFKIWVNGELLFARGEYHRGTGFDQYQFRTALKKGRNVLLLKLCQNEQMEDWAQKWTLQLRVCDRTGTAIASQPPEDTASR